ncbi:helix-turn-helix transcriptional regulator [Niveibacterium sp. SC-1]|uniref:helix-turn-helix transcriptional regulator n=1 Tax=Niveibacterium sp. SC-1 TaxID=3135646 RepID=UPI00311E71C2
MKLKKGSRRSAYIRHLCSLGLPDTQVIPAVAQALREHVDADHGMFFWAGEDYDLASVYAEDEAVYDSVSTYQQLRLNGHIGALIGDFRDWMRTGPRCTNSAHIDKQFTASEFFNEVVRPCDHRHWMVAVVRDHRRGWGCLWMARRPGRPSFMAAEQKVLESFGPHVLHAVRQPAREAVACVAAEEGSALIVDRAGRILHRGMGAERLLRLMSDDTLSGAWTHGALPPALGQLLLQLRRIERGLPAAPARREFHNRWGHFLWRAYVMQALAAEPDEGLVVLHGQLLAPTRLVKARGAHALGLSAQQQRICVRLAEGQAQRTIAADLGLGASTVVDHVRRAYRQLGVSSREDLAAALLDAGVGSGLANASFAQGGHAADRLTPASAW